MDFNLDSLALCDVDKCRKSPPSATALPRARVSHDALLHMAALLSSAAVSRVVAGANTAKPRRPAVSTSMKATLRYVPAKFLAANRWR